MRPLRGRLPSPAIVALLAGLAVLARGPAAHAAEPRISGVLFGDAYWVLSHHEKAIQDRTGFWFRRIYVTADQDLADGVAGRIRLEASDPGDFTTRSRLTPFVKEAYVRWSLGRHAITAGLSTAPTWAEVEPVWGYRGVEKTPLDLHRMGSPVDLGVALSGALGEGRRTGYRLMLANGGGVESEADRGKKVMASVIERLPSGLLVELYGDYEGRPGETDRATVQGFAGWVSERGRFGALLARQVREVAGGPDVALDLLSIFGSWNARGLVRLLGRYDRMFDRNPDAAKVPYLVLSPRGEVNFILFGVDVPVRGGVHIVPNVEAVVYSNAEGQEPDDDVLARVTLVASWP